MLSLSAPAKINLDLRVAPPRPDGFHPLSSWFITLDLADTLTFSLHPQPNTLLLTCSDPTLETDGRNLVVRAASDLLLSLPAEHPARNTGLSIHLTKRIPSGGGLGGGSSDAAHTLLALNDLLFLQLPATHLHRLAAALGSDVPFFLHAPSALCTSRGDIVQPLPTPRPLAALLALPSIRMPTPAVFREFDRLRLGSTLPSPPAHLAHYTSLARLPASDLLPHLTNDLEPAAFSLSPELSNLRNFLESSLARPVRMSGSGSTLFTLYDTLTLATAAATSAASSLANRLPSAPHLPPTQLLPVSLCPKPHTTTFSA